jgi:rubrerythrin
MVDLKPLNNTQIKEVMNLLTFYKSFYICNICGIVYGSDNKNDVNKRCPKCELIKPKEKKQNG